MIKIDGRKIAQQIINKLKNQTKPDKALVAVLVGESEASLSFIKQKEKVAEELGVEFKIFEFEGNIPQRELGYQLERLNNDDGIGGIIVQLPLPDRFNRDKLLQKLAPEKDVDNLTNEAAVEAPVIGVVEDILEDIDWDWENKVVVVVGSKSFLVGQPVVRWVGRKSLEVPSLKVKTADIETNDLQSFVADADLVISGVGKAGLIRAGWLKEGTGIIDFGFPPDLSEGDYGHLAFYTPTPSGTGPILVAELFKNFYKLNGSRGVSRLIS